MILDCRLLSSLISLHFFLRYSSHTHSLQMQKLLLDGKSRVFIAEFYAPFVAVKPASGRHYSGYRHLDCVSFV